MQSTAIQLSTVGLENTVKSLGYRVIHEMNEAGENEECPVICLWPRNKDRLLDLIDFISDPCFKNYSIISHSLDLNSSKSYSSQVMILFNPGEWEKPRNIISAAKKKKPKAIFILDDSAVTFSCQSKEIWIIDSNNNVEEKISASWYC